MINNDNHGLWVEKYRPDTIDGYIGNEKTIDKVKDFIEQKQIPNLLFHAGPGGGKTTLGKIITNSIPCDVLYINASDENNVDTIRTKVRNFATSAGFNGIKIIFLDEFDGMTFQAQGILRNLMETYSKHTRFILTCNYIDKIMPALQSRCQTYKIVPPDKKEVFKKLVTILKKEKVEFDVKNKEQLGILKVIVDKSFPDIRKCIQMLQQNVIGSELIFDDSTLVENEYTKRIVEELKNKPKYDENTFGIFKQILADSGQKSFDALYSEMYKTIEDISHGKAAPVLQIVAEYQYQSYFVVDKELSAMAMILRVVQQINAK